MYNPIENADKIREVIRQVIEIEGQITITTDTEKRSVQILIYLPQEESN